VKATLHKGLASGAEQQELPLLLNNKGRGGVSVSRSHIPWVDRKLKELNWIKGVLENHRLLTGLAMVIYIPLLPAVAIANIHNVFIIDGVLAIIGGLFGVHLWNRKPEKNGKTERAHD
jgi:hypothetical protein